MSAHTYSTGYGGLRNKAFRKVQEQMGHSTGDPRALLDRRTVRGVCDQCAW